jgi:hypothetical protein
MSEPTSAASIKAIADNTRAMLAGQRDRFITDGEPIFWPALTRQEAEEEWPRLYAWVEHLKARYPNGVRLPDCWWQHSDLIEALAALRDFERGCFAPRGKPTAAVEWQRAFRDTETRLELWIRRLPCAVTGRGHQPVLVSQHVPDAWLEVVRADIEARPRAVGD